MKHLEKYLVLKKNEKTNFCLIVFIKKTGIVINEISGQISTIEITHFKDTKTLATATDEIISTKVAQGYKEEILPSNISVFSIAMEHLKTDDLAQFESKFLILKELITVYYTGDKHPFVKFLGVKMKDESFVTTPILDEYLKKHIKEISSSVLVAIFQATLQNIYFNFEASSLAVQEIITRKDLEAQLAIVTQFFEACKYYDAGHRFWGSTNQDILIDTYFPQFESEALLKLLAETSDDMLSGDVGDAMDALFIPALQNTENKELQQNILEILERYRKEYQEYVEDDYFDILFEEIRATASDNVLKILQQIEEKKHA